MMLRALALTLLMVAAFLFTGCLGYQIGPAKPAVLAHVNSLAVPIFRNDTLEPHVEALVSGIVIKQIQQDGSYQIRNTDDADAILEGTITSVTRRRSRSVRGNVDATAEFTLVLGVRYDLIDRITGHVLDTRSVQGTTNFFVGNDLQAQERQAVVLAGEDAAIRIAGYLSEGW